MYIVQEIYYITTGSYKHRKECYLVYPAKAGYTDVMKVLTREQYECFNNQVNGNIIGLPSLVVTPKQFKVYESKIQY